MVSYIPLESEHWLISTDFKYARTTNALGFSDRNWHLENKPNEKRILSLGDSFTEGDGAPQDSAYPVLLEKIIKNTNSSFSVMNAGICGSDPFINFVNYRDHLAKYKPNYIIQTLASGDIVVDVFVRGGMERFKENNKISYTKAPWWEPLYATSYVSRLFFSALGYNQLLLKQNAVKLNKARLDQQMVALFKEYASLASSNECQFILILQPYKGEVQNGEYDYDFTSIKEGLKDVPNITILDLIPFYRQFAAKEKKTMDVFYWAQDGHHNASGYEMMAKGVYQCLDSIINPQLNQNPKLN
jgi:lysophospholipase L1-like esterase